KKKKQPKIVVVAPDEEPEEEVESKGRRPRKGRQLIFDEDAGEVVVRRKRKGSRKRPDWEEFDIEDLDEEF
ncbi:MAG: hypothetical protein D6835_01845, partial [Candidatus Thermofonsia bacterium]